MKNKITNFSLNSIKKFKHFSTTNIAYLGLGSNIGNRLSNFHKCVKMINENKIGLVEKTSQIYESPCLDENNLVVKDENKFFNSVIKIKTELSPMDLLFKCKEIESHFKRKPKLKYYEARELDIDILLYNNEVINLDSPRKLNIPHIHMYNRLFVLKPLLDINPELMIFNRFTKKQEKVIDILKNLLKNTFKNENYNFDKINNYDSIEYLYKTFNVVVNKNEINFDISKNSLLMGVINCTPDSFSGGLLKKLEDYDKIIEMLIKNKNNIDIIDIGGESTRPGSSEINPNIEFERIAPLIKKIRANDELKNKIISIDTRKSYVANESFKLGANIINDVSGGMFDPEIIKITSDNFAPYICMHSRASPDKMMQPEFLKYKNVINELNLELEDRINKIKKYSEERNTPFLDWNIIVDPGLGFSKYSEHNIHIVKNLDKIKSYFPNVFLLGHSKKKFIQEILNVKADNTEVGNIVISSLGIQKGANIIRVHEFEEIKQTIKISDALFKNK